MKIIQGWPWNIWSRGFSDICCWSGSGQRLGGWTGKLLLLLPTRRHKFIHVWIRSELAFGVLGQRGVQFIFCACQRLVYSVNTSLVAQCICIYGTRRQNVQQVLVVQKQVCTCSQRMRRGLPQHYDMRCESRQIGRPLRLWIWCIPLLSYITWWTKTTGLPCPG